MKPDMIIAVDPGGMTGLCTFFVNEGHCLVGQQLPPHEAIGYVESFLLTRKTALVVAEKFTITMNTVKMSRQDDALKVCGAIQYLTIKTGGFYEEQSPATAKKIAGDKRLKSLGLFVPGRGHANDAARHLVLGIERHDQSLLDNDVLEGYGGTATIERI